MRAEDTQSAAGREPARATPASGSPQAIIGRPFDGPGVARRIAPFIAVGIAAFGALPFMSPAQHPDEVLLAAAA